jgi:hypothetical protein
MTDAQRLQGLCETGQQRLMATDYLAAEEALVEAETLAIALDDFDTLGRLYFPLQEARRQRRQLCGEGTVWLDLWARRPEDTFEPDDVLEQHPQGQFLLAGWADLAASVALRDAISKRRLYAECFLAAAYPVDAAGRVAVAVVPTAEVVMPPVETVLAGGVEALQRRLPPHSLVLADDALPHGPRAGDASTFAVTMNLWEQLHLPHLSAARSTPDPRRRIEAYRRVITIDYACEKAHQWLADDALSLARAGRA